MGRRTAAIIGGALAGAVALASLQGAAARPKPPPLVATLSPGEAAFWEGPAGEGSHEFRLEVERGGARIRFLGQVPQPFRFLSGRAVAPDGRRYPFSTIQEAFVDDPQPGTWRVTVHSPSGDPFRVRAKLETRQDVAWPGKPMWLKPNLRSMPPYEFTFDNPYTAEGEVVSCHAEEMVEEGGRKCLRFSVGPENVGDGAFELYLAPLVDGTTGEATVHQRILHSSGDRMKLRDAGTYEYHKTHGHYHYAGFASLELLKVVDERRGRLAPAGTGKKIGFCTYDVVIADFESFAQDPRNSADSDCYASDGASIGLSRGWTDIYGWTTSGNYVEFGANEDGLYVVRSGFDTKDLVDETNERDNYAYALIRVAGTRVKILERGYGMDPWDPRREVVRPWWRSN